MRTACLLSVSQHALRRGVSAWGRECLHGWGMSCLPRGMSVQGGVCQGCLPRGVYLCRGMYVADPPPWTEWQTGVKTLPCRNFVAGGNYSVKVCPHRAKSNAKAKKIKEQSEEIKEQGARIKENFRFRVRFRLVWTLLNTNTENILV